MTQTVPKPNVTLATAAEPALIAIVGRPNVGKSTLFNRLTGSRRAIVGDEPGITRDRIYADANWRGRSFRIVDTGGILPDDKELIPSEIFRQAKVALEEASAIIMVVDARTELTAPDLELARLLNRSGKPLFLAINKVDSSRQETLVDDFHRLGIRKQFPISAEHGRGIDDLLDALIETLKLQPAAAEESHRKTGKAIRQADARAKSKANEPDSPDGADPEEGPALPNFLDYEPADDAGASLQIRGRPDPGEVKIAIIGHPNVGKSTLLNRLTGSSRAIVSAIPGTTRDAVDEVVERDSHKFRFVDTAGIRRKGKTRLMAEKLSVVMARKHMEAADIALLVIDATEGVSALDASIAGYAHESGRSVIIVVNKWDLITSGQKKAVSQSKAARIQESKRATDRTDYEHQLRYALKFLSYAPVLFVSAETGKGIDKIFPTIELVARERRKRISTSEMNRFLKHVDFERASVPVSKRVKIYYLTQADTAPPTFILFTDRPVKLHFSYQRFLENQIREAFGFIGTPIWIKNRARD
jgi:GTPase